VAVIIAAMPVAGAMAVAERLGEGRGAEKQGRAEGGKSDTHDEPFGLAAIAAGLLIVNTLFQIMQRAVG